MTSSLDDTAFHRLDPVSRIDSQRESHDITRWQWHFWVNQTHWWWYLNFYIRSLSPCESLRPTSSSMSDENCSFSDSSVTLLVVSQCRGFRLNLVIICRRGKNLLWDTFAFHANKAQGKWKWIQWRQWSKPTCQQGRDPRVGGCEPDAASFQYTLIITRWEKRWGGGGVSVVWGLCLCVCETQGKCVKCSSGFDDTFVRTEAGLINQERGERSRGNKRKTNSVEFTM